MRKAVLWFTAFFLAVLGGLTGQWAGQRASRTSHAGQATAPHESSLPHEDKGQKSTHEQIVSTTMSAQEHCGYIVSGENGRIVVCSAEDPEEILCAYSYSEKLLSEEEAKRLKQGFQTDSWEEAMMILEAFLE